MRIIISIVVIAISAVIAEGAVLQQPQAVPTALLGGITQYGSQVLVSEIQKVQKSYNDSVDAFIPVNASCNAILQSKLDRCKTCVTNSCKSRAQKVCKPAEWQLILAKGIGFFAKDVPHFFASSLPGFFVDTLGKEIINVGGEIGDFFGGTLPNSFVDIGKSIGSGVVDIGKDIGHEIGHIGTGIVDIGEKIGHGVIDLGTDILHGITGTLGKIGHLFGKRRRSMVEVIRATGGTGEPGCDDIKNNASAACQTYIALCSDCAINANTDCPGYKEAMQNIVLANNGRAWLKRATQLSYSVNSVTIDASSFDPRTTGYSRAEAIVSILGKTIKFSVSQSINPYNPVTSGPIIAKQAIAEFKKAN